MKKKKKISITFDHKPQQIKPYGFFIKCQKDITKPYDKEMKTESCFIYINADKDGEFEVVREIDPVMIGNNKYIDTKGTLIFRPNLKHIDANGVEFSTEGRLCRTYTDDVFSWRRNYKRIYEFFQHTPEELEQQLCQQPQGGHIDMKVNDFEIQKKMPDVKENRYMYLEMPMFNENNEPITDINQNQLHELVRLSVNLKTGTIFDIQIVKDDDAQPYPMMFIQDDDSLSWFKLCNANNGQKYFVPRNEPKYNWEPKTPENISELIDCDEKNNCYGGIDRFNLRACTHSPQDLIKNIKNYVIDENIQQQAGF